MKIVRTLSILFTFFFLVGVFNPQSLNAQVRNPVLEFCTGTWCQYCPCGHEIIANDIMPNVPNAIIIAYHGYVGSGDPYASFYGNNIVNLLGMSSYPTGIADRTSSPVSRTQWQTRMVARQNVAPTVEISIQKSFDTVTKQFFAIAKVTALEDLTGDFYINLIMLENNLVHSQTGNSGCTGGSSYKHDHVVRSMINGALGQTINNNEDWTEGVTKSVVIENYITGNFVYEDCELVALVYKKNNATNRGEIQQAEKYEFLGGDSFNMVVDEGWNILSVPKEAADMSASTLFPSATSPVYGYNNGYNSVSTVENGKGYWAKFSELEGISVQGDEPTGGVEVAAGWNLIGPYSTTVNTSAITTQPEGIIETSFYGFSGSYSTTTQLKSGKGYWVKTSEAGTVYFSSSKASKENIQADMPSEEWPYIVFTDANYKTAKLYLTSSSVNLDRFEMPPAPPADAADVRFASNRYVESVNSFNNINISGMTYPVTVSVRGADLQFNTPESEYTLKANESFVLNNGGTLSVNSVNIPSEFILHQNYPNPFNPETKIKFEIPASSKVNLSVYDLLGQKVTELFSGYMEAGVHEVNFNASNLSSGVYLYKLSAGEFSVTKKMSVLK